MEDDVDIWHYAILELHSGNGGSGCLLLANEVAYNSKFQLNRLITFFSNPGHRTERMFT